MSRNVAWPHEASPFHAGERRVQEKLGVREMMESFGRKVIRDHMPEQHRAFYQQLPFITAGHVDADGRVWASILSGRPGFMSPRDDRSMLVATRPADGDPLTASLAVGLRLGFVGMDPASRRRNRLNTRVVQSTDEGFVVEVDQAFGNCPQYIQTRAIEFIREPTESHTPPVAEQLESLDVEARSLIGRADTFFVASASSGAEQGRDGGADASHRGGLPGFVRVDADGVLTIPDYSGNDHYNTLGNFELNPRAGLLFIDFERGDLLMLTGSVEVIWEGAEVNAFRGAERLWKFKLERGLRLRDRLPMRWSFGEISPNNKLTGSWAETAATLAAETARETWRPYRVVRVHDESEVIRSFYLEPSDGAGLSSYQPGQHIPIRLPAGADGACIVRTYTLSSAPNDRHYRISVKRESQGTVSRFLHDQLEAGSTIEAKAPRGQFTFDSSEKRPAVLLSGGVGVTPMISMLQHAVSEGVRTRYTRSTIFIHAARTTSQRAFFDDASQLEIDSGGAVRVVSFVGRPAAGDEPGRDFHGIGRITKEALREILALDDYDFYLCGPASFMQAMYDALRELGARDARIHAEAFGPSALTRQPDAGAVASSQPAPAADAIIEFADSKFEMPWTPKDGSLLELAESHGLTPAYGCRNGTCGSCAVPLRAGAVTYPNTPGAEPPDGHALICCAVPAKSDSEERVVLEL
jgi:ferredoxin-NADP reductase/predicted pyridoxine 5'-phosphate oxidase superfamily flavin-nucleotide-binding protein